GNGSNTDTVSVRLLFDVTGWEMPVSGFELQLTETWLALPTGSWNVMTMRSGDVSSESPSAGCDSTTTLCALATDGASTPTSTAKAATHASTTRTTRRGARRSNAWGTRVR